jgi:hypothetical protein
MAKKGRNILEKVEKIPQRHVVASLNADAAPSPLETR